jgi:hypothetical protein
MHLRFSAELALMFTEGLCPKSTEKVHDKLVASVFWRFNLFPGPLLLLAL